MDPTEVLEWCVVYKMEKEAEDEARMKAKVQQGIAEAKARPRGMR